MKYTLLTTHTLLLRIRMRKLLHAFSSHKAVGGSMRAWRGTSVWVRSLITLAAIASIGGVAWLGLAAGASPQTVTLTRDDLMSGASQFAGINVTNDGSTLELQKGVVGKWNATTSTGLQALPSMVYGVSNIVYGPNDTLYTLTSFAMQCHFSRYDVERQSWESLNTPPISCGAGTTLAFDGKESFYYTPGGSTNTPSNRLFRYDIKDDSWHGLANFTAAISNVSSSVFVGQGSNKFLYLFRGMSSPSFWRYSVATDSWDSLASFPAASNVNSGVVLTYDGSNTLYALANDTGEFKKFDLTTNSWSSLPTVSGSSCTRHSLQYANGKILAMRLQACSERPQLRSYDIASGQWTDLTSPPSPANVYDFPLPLSYDGSRFAYTLIGPEIRPELYRYDTIDNTWNGTSLLIPDQDNSGYHQQVIYDGAQSAYYFGGTYSSNVDRIYKLDIPSKQVTRVGSQIGTTSGFRGAFYNGSVYVLPMPSSSVTFQRYDTATNNLVTLADTPITTTSGGDLVYGGDGYMYVVFGGNRSNFYRYNISANTWHALGSMPQYEGNGGGIVRVGRMIYVLSGAQTSFMMQYNMDTTVWSTIQGVPSGGVDHGAFIASDQTRYLYIGMSSRTDSTAKKIYRFDTTTASWQRVADLPAVTKPYASSFYDTSLNKLYVSQGQVSSALWDWSPNAANYVTTGTWYSKTYDLKQVSSWQSLDAVKTGNVIVYTRTSSSGKLWSDWQQVTGTSINSPVDRYLQLKIVLSGDGVTTSSIKNISINHSQETAPPNLPPQFSASATKGGAPLNSGQTYEHQHPYFSWNGADDGVNGSGVAGYYVYFGIDSNADPVTYGNYQTSQNYTTTTPMTAGEVYYLRIKVKDNLGNISSASTYFSYRYFYISPPGSVVKTSTADFSEGVNTNVAITNGSMQLQSIPGGAWSTGPMKMPPEDTRGGAQQVVGDYIYVARGSNTNTFWRYSLITQAWSTLSATPGNINAGSSLASDGKGNLYLLAGGSTTNFYRYSIENNLWEDLNTKLPANAQFGSDIVSIGSDKFAILFTGVREFYIFDAASSQFSTAQAYPTSIGDAGSGLWFDGNDTVYAYLGSWDWGNTSSTRNSMAKYSVSTDSWRTLANPPVLATYTQNNLVSDGRGGLYIFSHDLSDNLTKRQHAMRYDIALDSWSEAPGLSDQVYYGSATSDGKRYIYILPGGNSTNSRKIVRYDTWNTIFTPLTKTIDALDRIPYDTHVNAWQWVGGNASTAVYDGSKYIYAIAGSESTTSWSRFIKYDHQTGNTIYLPAPPIIGLGGSLGYVNNEIYYLPARNTKDFYKFDEASSQWLRMSDAPSSVYRPGPASLVTVGDSFYTTVGNSRIYYKYTPGSGGGTWTRLQDAPSNILNSAAAYDASDNSIYMIAGNNTTAVYRYDITANSWSTKASLPASSSQGGAMTLRDGKLYAQIGNITKNSYIYDIGSNSWSTGTAAPEQFRYGSTILKISDSYALAFAGEASPDIWQFNYPSNSSAYDGLATHISQPFTIAGVYDYAGITAQLATPTNTSVELWVRSSDDGNNWDDWTISDNIKTYNSTISGRIASKARKYTQIKVVLQSDDNLLTPVVDSYAVHYYYDIDPPTNPSTVTVYTDATKTTPATSNTWYNGAKPVFDWPDPGQPGGATDGPLGSNLAGYWVYVGTDPTASPRTAGIFVTATELQANLTISGSYYLRIQAQDITGNIDSAIYAPYVYKFDNQAPTNPSLITVTPSGFTTKNNFTFEWPNSYDAHSGVAGYCYHTGATSGPFAAELCQPGTKLTNISAAYRTGTNIMYVRTYDTSGNYSPSYTTVSYYYTTDPPGPATNLRAIPPTSNQSMFAFAWDLPALFSGDPDLLRYCYSINILPSPPNTTCVSDRFLSSFKAATQQGTNTIYLVAKDEAGNANWNNFASANFIANTVSPGIPLNLVVSDTSDRVSNRWSLTATWDTPTFVGNGIKHYIIERSEDGHTFTELGNTSTRAFVDLTVQPESTYHYRVRAADNVDNRGGASAIVSQAAKGSFATPPQIVVQPTASTGFDQAKVNWATSRDATSFVYYGASPTDLSQSKGSLDLLTDHTQTLTGLQPSTTYYYRVQSFDNDRNYKLNDSSSSIFTFRTTEAARIFDVAMTDVTSNSLVLSWQTSVPTRARIEYGPTLGYGLSTDEAYAAYSSKHTVKLTSLASGTPYHFRILSTTEFGSKLTSDDYAFETIARPQISDIRFQPLDDAATAGVRVSWRTNVPTSSTVRYSALGDRLETTLSDLTTDHEITLRDLASSTDYSITTEGRDQYGNLASSPVQTWRSQLDTRAPVISEMSFGVTTTDTSKGRRAQIIASWKTDEPATSQLTYATGSKTIKTPLDTEPTTNHVAIISELNLADIYKIQIISRDLNGNTVHGQSTTIVTPDKEVGVFDNVLNLMLKLFRL